MGGTDSRRDTGRDAGRGRCRGRGRETGRGRRTGVGGLQVLVLGAPHHHHLHAGLRANVHCTLLQELRAWRPPGTDAVTAVLLASRVQRRHCSRVAAVSDAAAVAALHFDAAVAALGLEHRNHFISPHSPAVPPSTLRIL